MGRKDGIMKRRYGRIMAGVFAVAMAFSVTACGDSTKETSAVSTEASTKAEGTTGEAKTEAVTEETTEGKTDTSANWVFKKGDITIELNAPAEPVLQALGDPQNTYEAPSCAFDGMDVIYKYADFRVLTYKNDTSFVISGVVLDDDLVTTVEGACIGMAQADVEKIYGKTADTASTLQIDKGNCTLLFIFEDGKVSSIQYNMKQQ